MTSQSTDRIVSFNDAIEEIGYGKFQQRLMWVCGLGWAADAMEVLLISFALPAIAEEWGLSAGQKGLLLTSVFIGMLAGSLVWGRLSDIIGRKTGFIATIALDSGFGLLSAFAPGFGSLLALRSLTGFGVGGTLPVDYSMFSEYLPIAKRGRNLVLLESFWALGTVVAAGLAWLIVPTLGWRWLLAISALPGIIILFIRRLVPESPRYLMAQGKTEEAFNVLKHVASVNGTTLNASGIRPIEVKPAKISDLLTKKLRKTTLLMWVIWFFISLGYYGVFTWLPNYFRSTGMETLPVYQNVFILAIAQLPGYFSAAFFIEKIGRRKTLAAYLFISGIFTFLFAMANSLTFLVFMGIWMSFFTLGAWGALYAFTPEAFPTSLRGTGMGSASAWTRVSGALAPTIGAFLMGESFILPLVVFASAYMVASLAALLLNNETKGTPLEDTL